MMPQCVTTENNRRIVMGHNSITNAYVKVAWTVTSDARDKTSIESVPHGLSFVQQLNPVSYRWKTSREDETPHGNRRYGFLAQDILALEGDDPVIIDNEQPDHLKYQGEALVPVLVNAIKELSAKCDSLQAEINTLKGQ
jgi:trimeric autotransporter adhesin